MNNFRMRKFFARLLLPILTVWMCWMPSQAYAAFTPASISPVGIATQEAITAGSASNVIVGPWGGSTAGAASTVGAIDILAGAGVIAVGAAMSYFAIDYFIGDQLQTVRIPLRDTTANAVPAPAAAPTDTPMTMYYGYVSGGSYGTEMTWGEACSSVVYSTGDCPAGFSCVIASNNPTTSCNVIRYYSGHVGDPSWIDGSWNHATVISNSGHISCPSGYTASGQTCVLADARQAAPDKACDLERSGSALAMISDPDCAASGEALPIICDGVNFWCGGRGVNAGQPVQYKVIPRASGGSGVQVQQQQIINGQSQVKTTNIEVNSAGVVESVSGQVQAGTIASPSGASASVHPVAPTIDTAASPQSPSGQSITFPSDYARTGEAATAADGIKTRLDTLHNDLSSTTNTTDPIEPTANDMPGWGNTFSGLLSWQLPAHSGTCPTPSLDLSSVLGVGKVYAFDAHCTLINNHFQALNAAMTVVWSMLALFIVLRA